MSKQRFSAGLVLGAVLAIGTATFDTVSQARAQTAESETAPAVHRYALGVSGMT